MVLGAVNKRLRGSYVTRTWEKGSVRETVFNRVMPVVHAAESAALVGMAVYSRVKARAAGETVVAGPLLSAPWS